MASIFDRAPLGSADEHDSRDPLLDSAESVIDPNTFQRKPKPKSRLETCHTC